MSVYPDNPYPPPTNQPPLPMYQPPPPVNATVVMTQPTAVPGSMCPYRQLPCRIQCQFCQAQVITSTQYTVGTFAWLVGGILCLVGCNLGCCLIPCCVDGCKDTIHTCPNCRQTVGRFNRL